MKHKFDGQICIYCNNAPAESSDHVVARKFFLEERRADLPQAPACKWCNNRKSKLENYLMIVLGFGAKHRDAQDEENARAAMVAHVSRVGEFRSANR